MLSTIRLATGATTDSTGSRSAMLGRIFGINAACARLAATVLSEPHLGHFTGWPVRLASKFWPQ